MKLSHKFMVANWLFMIGALMSIFIAPLGFIWWICVILQILCLIMQLVTSK